MINFILVIAVYHTLGGNPVVTHTEHFADRASCVEAGKLQVDVAKKKFPDADFTCYRRKIHSQD